MSGQLAEYYIDILEFLDQLLDVEEFYKRVCNLRDLILENDSTYKESYFVACFIQGLKQDIGEFVLQCGPANLKSAYAFALQRESENETEENCHATDDIPNLEDLVVAISPKLLEELEQLAGVTAVEDISPTSNTMSLEGVVMKATLDDIPEVESNNLVNSVAHDNIDEVTGDHMVVSSAYSFDVGVSCLHNGVSYLNLFQLRRGSVGALVMIRDKGGTPNEIALSSLCYDATVGMVAMEILVGPASALCLQPPPIGDHQCLTTQLSLRGDSAMQQRCGAVGPAIFSHRLFDGSCPHLWYKYFYFDAGIVAFGLIICVPLLGLIQGGRSYPIHIKKILMAAASALFPYFNCSWDIAVQNRLAEMIFSFSIHASRLHHVGDWFARFIMGLLLTLWQSLHTTCSWCVCVTILPLSRHVIIAVYVVPGYEIDATIVFLYAPQSVGGRLLHVLQKSQSWAICHIMNTLQGLTGTFMNFPWHIAWVEVSRHTSLSVSQTATLLFKLLHDMALSWIPIACSWVFGSTWSNNSMECILSNLLNLGIPRFLFWQAIVGHSLSRLIKIKGRVRVTWGISSLVVGTYFNVCSSLSPVLSLTYYSGYVTGSMGAHLQRYISTQGAIVLVFDRGKFVVAQPYFLWVPCSQFFSTIASTPVLTTVRIFEGSESFSGGGHGMLYLLLLSVGVSDSLLRAIQAAIYKYFRLLLQDFRTVCVFCFDPGIGCFLFSGVSDCNVYDVPRATTPKWLSMVGFIWHSARFANFGYQVAIYYRVRSAKSTCGLRASVIFGGLHYDMLKLDLALHYNGIGIDCGRIGVCSGLVGYGYIYLWVWVLFSFAMLDPYEHMVVLLSAAETFSLHLVMWIVASMVLLAIELLQVLLLPVQSVFSGTSANHLFYGLVSIDLVLMRLGMYFFDASVPQYPIVFSYWGIFYSHHTNIVPYEEHSPFQLTYGAAKNLSLTTDKLFPTALLTEDKPASKVMAQIFLLKPVKLRGRIHGHKFCSLDATSQPFLNGNSALQSLARAQHPIDIPPVRAKDIFASAPGLVLKVKGSGTKICSNFSWLRSR